MRSLLGIRHHLLNFLTIFISFFIWRIFYFIYFKHELDSGFQTLIKAFYLGFKFDARVAATLVLPLLPISYLVKRWNVNILYKAYTLIIAFTVTFFYFVDLGFSSYLGTRLNSSSLKFLENPIISANMVWETYPVIIGALLLFIFSMILYRSLQYVREYTVTNINIRSSIASFFILFLFIYGKFSFYPLRWSEAFFSTNDKVGHFVMNPIHYFMDSLRYKDKPYDKSEVKKSSKIIGAFLNKDLGQLDFSRLLKPTTHTYKKPNIILIVMESMASNKTTVFGNKLNPTPPLAKLLDNSYFYKKFFTPTEATARSVFATVTGIADVSSGKFKSSSRNPFTVNQHTIINEFKEYSKYYFLGGSANWGNIRGVFSNNISDIKIYEEGNLKSPRNDVWGVSDLDLFQEAAGILNTEKKPFFAFLQSSGFHRPYTIPDSRGDYKIKKISNKKALANGFRNSEEFNSIRFQDYALEMFMKTFKKSPQYKNTIIAIIGDHGLPSSYSNNLPRGYFEHALVKHHVPLVIHSPLFKNKVVSNKVVSQVDLLPTLAHLAGIKYKNTSFGRSIFNTSFDSNRYAFLYSWQSQPRKISLVSDRFVLIDNGGRTAMYDYENDNNYKKDLKSDYPKEFEKMSNLVKGIYETSKYLLYHNKK